MLGDAGGGVIQCLAPGECTGSGCNKTCDAGPGSSAADRYALLGFSSYASESVGGNYGSAYEAWCAWMQSDGDRKQNIYGNFTQVGTGAYQAPGTACSGWYWTEAYGTAPGIVPNIPAASAMYAPPNPANTSALYFAANYYDRGGKGPRRSEVVVSGHCFDLDRTWGYDDNGTYEAHFLDPDVLPEGCHPYYFLFLDADAGRHTYPDVGSLQVALGQNATCPLPYDPSPQEQADCETGVQQCPQGAEQACYTADPASLAHGECRQGWQVCRNGFWSACRDMIGPFPEACDGLDNNCDGQVDEGDPGGGGDCEVPGERGECKPGKLHCLSGRLTCVSINGPQTEVCDGKDNDCDGVVDDGFPIVTCGKGECFRVVQGCVNGVPGVCVPGTPSPEVADFKDNDCDGIVDNGIDCRLADAGLAYPRQCYSFALRLPDGGGRCRPRRASRARSSARPTPAGDRAWARWGPTPEVCDGIDNDCDGRIDENDEIGWDRCGSGQCTVFTAKCARGSAGQLHAEAFAAGSLQRRRRQLRRADRRGLLLPPGRHPPLLHRTGDDARRRGLPPGRAHLRRRPLRPLRGRGHPEPGVVRPPRQRLRRGGGQRLHRDAGRRGAGRGRGAGPGRRRRHRRGGGAAEEGRLRLLRGAGGRGALRPRGRLRARPAPARAACRLEVSRPWRRRSAPARACRRRRRCPAPA